MVHGELQVVLGRVFVHGQLLLRGRHHGWQSVLLLNVDIDRQGLVIVLGALFLNVGSVNEWSFASCLLVGRFSLRDNLLLDLLFKIIRGGANRAQIELLLVYTANLFVDQSQGYYSFTSGDLDGTLHL